LSIKNRQIEVILDSWKRTLEYYEVSRSGLFKGHGEKTTMTAAQICQNGSDLKDCGGLKVRTE